jgi:hypothetical protein
MNAPEYPSPGAADWSRAVHAATTSADLDPLTLRRAALGAYLARDPFAPDTTAVEPLELLQALDDAHEACEERADAAAYASDAARRAAEGTMDVGDAREALTDARHALSDLADDLRRLRYDVLAPPLERARVR